MTPVIPHLLSFVRFGSLWRNIFCCSWSTRTRVGDGWRVRDEHCQAAASNFKEDSDQEAFKGRGEGAL